MKIAALILALASSALGLLSAWYWYRTSRIDPVPSWAKDCGTEPVIPEIGTLGWIAGFLEASQASSALNRKAALTTAAAVALGALGNLLASWPIG